MAKHEESLKLEVVQRYLSGSAGAKALAKQYGTEHSVIRSWIARYVAHGEKGLRKKFSSYSAEFKLSVLQRVKQQMLSHRQAAVTFDLRGGGSVVRKWQRQYDEGGLQALQPQPRGRQKMMPKPPESPPPPQDDARTLEELREENEALRAEVAYLKKLEALVRANRQAAQKERKPYSS